MPETSAPMRPCPDLNKLFDCISVKLNGRIYARHRTFNNSAAPVVGEIEVKELVATTIHRMSWWDVFLPKDPESFTYDADGNLTQDGVWHYTWDAENRLKSMQMRDEVAEVIIAQDPVEGRWVHIDFAYDWMGRRIRKSYQTTNADPSESGGKYGPPILWMISRDTRYVYDGWMLSMSYKTTGSSLEDQSFAWGPDLSSSYGGAGGIGGLVAYSDDEHDALNPAPSDPDFLGPMFPIYDGNGNIVKMIRFESLGGTPEVFEAKESASYEYGPFGENRSTTGELGAPASGGTHQGQRNPFRFSTKYTDAETGLVYYGYRYYSANLGRWINRDPIGEQVFQQRNIESIAMIGEHSWSVVLAQQEYAFVRNAPVAAYDPVGLTDQTGGCRTCGPDVTDWLIKQMNRNKNHQVIKDIRGFTLELSEPTYGLARLYSLLTKFRDLVKAGAPWDFKATVSFVTDSCPKSDECVRTVTLCGLCVDYDVPGNIHYGYVGRAARLRRSFLLEQAAKAQLGGVDPPEDVAAITIGMDLVDTKSSALCPKIRARANSLNYGTSDRAKKCKACKEKLTKPESLAGR